jgi:heat shock protein 5
MIKDAEKNAEADRILKEKHEAKQSLEQYLFTMKQTIEDKDKLGDKLESGDKSTIRGALDEASSWLSSNEEAGTKEEFESQLKSVQKVCDPIIAKIYQKFGGN